MKMRSGNHWKGSLASPFDGSFKGFLLSLFFFLFSLSSLVPLAVAGNVACTRDNEDGRTKRDVRRRREEDEKREKVKERKERRRRRRRRRGRREGRRIRTRKDLSFDCFPHSLSFPFLSSFLSSFAFFFSCLPSPFLSH